MSSISRQVSRLFRDKRSLIEPDWSVALSDPCTARWSGRAVVSVDRSVSMRAVTRALERAPDKSGALTARARVSIIASIIGDGLAIPA